jgi:RNA polymerase sigma factor (sigma-70 family)
MTSDVAVRALRYAPPMQVQLAGDGTDGPAEWLQAAASGDQQAWDHLVDRFAGLVWSVIRGFRLGSADAGDVFQTTWLRLVEHAGRIQQPERVGAWLASTARHECLAVLRKGARYGGGEDVSEEIVDLRPGPDHALLTEERDRALRIALGQISERCQQLLRLLATDPAPSYVEVSVALDMPIGSIGPTRSRCLEHLRHHLTATRPGFDLPSAP